MCGAVGIGCFPMVCNLRSLRDVTFERFPRDILRRPAPRQSRSRSFLPALAAPKAGQVTSWVRALEAASWPWRDIVEEAGCDRRTGDPAVRPTGRLVGYPQTPPRPSSSARALLVAVGTYVSAEFGSCADAKLAVGAR
jgi:hypothetical protein